MGIETGTGMALAGAGSALGGLMGSKKQTTTSQQVPVLPDNFKEGFNTLLDKGLETFNTPRQAPLMRRVVAPTDWKDNAQLYAAQQDADKKYVQGLLTPKPAATTGDAATPSLQSGLNALIGQFQNQISQNPGYSLKTNAPGVGDVRAQFMADPMGFMKQLGIDTNNPQAYRAVQAALGFNQSGYTG